MYLIITIPEPPAKPMPLGVALSPPPPPPPVLAAPAVPAVPQVDPGTLDPHLVQFPPPPVPPVPDDPAVLDCASP